MKKNVMLFSILFIFTALVMVVFISTAYVGGSDTAGWPIIRADSTCVTFDLRSGGTTAASLWEPAIEVLADTTDPYNILDVERVSGGSFTQPWRLNAGWRMRS